jgi:hypothetical protein
MMFSGTYGCGPCRLRFAKRETCPSCGSTEVIALTDARGRARFVHLAARARVGELPLPRPAIVALAGLLVSIPALVTHPVLAGSAAAAGVVLVLATRRPASAPRLPPPPMRVYVPAFSSPGSDPAERVRLEGIARLATVESPAPISGATCLLFGLRGAVGDAELDDADGGDFDLELDSGERVSVSLEHARLEPRGDAPPSARDVDLGDASAHADLRAFLVARAIDPPGGVVRLDEVVVRAGARVAVSGRPLGGKLVTFGRRPGAGFGRAIGGDVDAPLVVELI